MSYRSRCLVVICIVTFFTGLASSVYSAPQAEEVVIDLHKSAVMREGLYINDLTQTLEPVLTDSFLLWLNKHDVKVASVLRALMAAHVKEVTLLWTTKDFLLDLELPGGDTTMLATGEMSKASLQKAIGDLAADSLAQGGRVPPAKSKEVAEGVFQISSGLFYAVAGQHVLLGSSADQVEVSRNKMRTGSKITAVPDLGQHIWTKTDFHVSQATTAAGPFSGKKLSVEYNVFKTDQGWEYRGSHNYPDILPVLSAVQPITMQGLPFFGEHDPVFVLFIGGSLLDALGQVSFKDMLPSANSSLKEVAPFALADISRLGFVLGGVNSQVVGVDLTGAYLVVEGADSVLTVLQAMSQALIPGSWRQETIAGWDTFIVTDLIEIEGQKFPIPALIARRGNQMVVGTFKHTPVPPVSDKVNTMQASTPDTKGSLFLANSISALWGELRNILKPGSPIRVLGGLDSHLTGPQAEAFNALMESEPPLKEVSYWMSPDMKELKGQLILDENPQVFIERLCNLIDTISPPRQ